MLLRTKSNRGRVLHWEKVKAKHDPDHSLSPRLCNFSATLVSGKIYLFGGLNSFTRSNAIFALDYVRRQWMRIRTKGIAPESRSLHSTCLAEDALIIISGNSQMDCLSDMWAFDLTTRTWESKRFIGDVPGRSYGHTAEFIPGIQQVALVKTGEWQDGTCSLFLIRPINWECRRVAPKGPWPCSRSHHMSCTIGNVLFLFGGHRGRGYLNDLWSISFDKAQPSWEKIRLTGSILPRVYRSTFAHYNGQIIVFGGQCENELLNDIYIINLGEKQCVKVVEKASGKRNDTIVRSGIQPQPSFGHAYVSHGKKMFLLGGIKFLPHYHILEMDLD